MTTNAIYLKVKACSLAQEARIIRRLEKRRRNRPWRKGLQDHRRWDLRREARATHLARAFLKGKAWSDVESANTLTMFSLERVKDMVAKYGVQPSLEAKWDGEVLEAYRLNRTGQMVKLDHWLAAAQSVITANQLRASTQPERKKSIPVMEFFK